jgi:hypothetical protein
MKKQQSQQKSRKSNSERGSHSRGEGRMSRSQQSQGQNETHRAGEGGPEQNAGGPEHQGLSGDVDKNP